MFRIYNLKQRRELGTLLYHDGTITSLVSADKGHCLSAADDGLICIWQTSDWTCLKALKAHKGSVNSLAVHPAGIVLLSAGRDRTVKTWDLTSVPI